MTDDLADHVLGLRWRGIRVLFPFPADWPLGDVVRPDVGRDAGWGFAKAAQGYSTCIYPTLIKKKGKFSSYIRKFRGIGCKVVYH
jgi:hypothetical protein